MRMKTLIALGACLFTTAAIAGDHPAIMIGDPAWLASNACSVPDTVEVPGVGILADQCALERAMKERLRQGPIFLEPVSDAGRI